MGVLLSPQGIITFEADAIDFALDANVGNTYTRYDLLIATQNYIATAGGQDCVYSVIKGPIGNAILPSLTDPLKQMIIGIVELPPNTAGAPDCIYTKAKCPDSGDGEDARIDIPNLYQATQLFSKAAPLTNRTEIIVGPTTGYVWELLPTGNTFEIFPINNQGIDGLKIKGVIPQAGTEINVVISEKAPLRTTYGDLPPNFRLEGYRPLTIPASFYNDFSNPLVSQVRPPAGEIYIISFLFYNDTWRVMEVYGNINKGFPKGGIIGWYGDVNANFDTTGLGINAMRSYAVCNGNNGTPDERGLFDLMATDVPATGAPALQTNAIGSSVDTYGGDYTKAILKTNLPLYDLPINQVAHHHTKGGMTLNGNGGGGSNHALVEGLGGDSYVFQTDDVSIDISVSTGGSGLPLDIINPYYAKLRIMKIA